MEKYKQIQKKFNNYCLFLKKKQELEQTDIMNKINSLKKYLKLNSVYAIVTTIIYLITLINFGIIIPTFIFGTIYGYLSYDSYQIFKNVRKLRKENMEFHLNYINELNMLQNEFNNKIYEKQNINVINYNYSINKKLDLTKTKK